MSGMRFASLSVHTVIFVPPLLCVYIAVTPISWLSFVCNTCFSAILILQKKEETLRIEFLCFSLIVLYCSFSLSTVSVRASLIHMHSKCNWNNFMNQISIVIIVKIIDKQFPSTRIRSLHYRIPIIISA